MFFSYFYYLEVVKWNLTEKILMRAKLWRGCSCNWCEDEDYVRLMFRITSDDVFEDNEVAIPWRFWGSFFTYVEVRLWKQEKAKSPLHVAGGRRIEELSKSTLASSPFKDASKCCIGRVRGGCQNDSAISYNAAFGSGYVEGHRD